MGNFYGNVGDEKKQTKRIQLQQTMDQVESVTVDNAQIKDDLNQLTQDTNKQITEKGDKEKIEKLGIQFENKVKKMQVLFRQKIGRAHV